MVAAKLQAGNGGDGGANGGANGGDGGGAVGRDADCGGDVATRLNGEKIYEYAFNRD